MAGGSGGRNLEQTPTWAVAVVCFVLILISIIIEHIIHLIAKWLKKKKKIALYESLEKIKSELMLLGFISLLLTVGQSLITRTCISEQVANTWHPCSDELDEEEEQAAEDSETTGRRLLAALLDPDSATSRRVLAAGGGDDNCPEGKVAFVSSDGIHQLHIFIFVLACFHVLYCILTLALGRAKMRRWKRWEEETRTLEYQFTHDPERFRFAKDTSFGRRHLSCWTKHPLLIWIVCFFRQFVRSVIKVDYLTLRHGFMMAHLSPQSQESFDFRKYIKRSLEEDFKVVVGISPPIWAFAVLFLLSNTHGWYAHLWFPFIPLVIILLVGTKLQVIITEMGLKIQERGDVVKGVPLVQPGDDLFWFNRPRLLLYLIHFVLFQNAFQLAFFSWSALQFGVKSCFHSQKEDVIIRITMGVFVQILCSYVTLPLYALVTQMGSSMKATIFNERVVAALRKWHHRARKEVKRKRGSVGSVSETPSPSMSPVSLLRYYRSEADSVHTSPRKTSMEAEFSASPPHYSNAASSSNHQRQVEMEPQLGRQPGTRAPSSAVTQLEIDIAPNKEFSFDKRVSDEALN
ncbi:MLO-like protein 6 [Prosopis cineraria]|uniref:MLO-like protein 6 n=1 Tax=Prosopis cineraria TaxID=364024 RepID=UPI00240FAFFA|nr:MLO-like protein 6 [Prosopis cineraria]